MKGIRKRRKWVACALLLGLTYLVFHEVQGHGFVNYDDPLLITQNPQVLRGLTWEGLGWALTSRHALNWHPLTWVSHMLDVQLFGLHPGAHHLTSLLLHMVSSLLLFLALHRLTGALWRPAFVASLFAVHPLHVESVAWAAERKDVLSALWWNAAIFAYARYGKTGARSSYFAVLLFFTLGLLSKPMVVTLPFALLLLDYWPLGRMKRGGDEGRLPLVGLVLEKVPLFALSAGSCVTTLWAQRAGGAVVPFETLSLTVRIQNALVSTGTYVLKTFWPAGLAVFYPHPQKIPWTETALAAFFLLAVTGWILATGKKRGYLPVGWFWFLGTLVPVIGLVQVGSQASADRYTYLPLVGLFLMVVWGLRDLCSRFRMGAAIWGGALGSVLVCLGTLASLQVSHWRDDKSLYNHALAVTVRNTVAHYNLGVALEKEGNVEAAMTHYRQALLLNPRHDMALNNLGKLLAMKGRYAEALSCFRKAMALRPDNVRARTNLGVALSRTGRLQEALREQAEAVRIAPHFFTARQNYGFLLAQMGRHAEAARQFQEAVRLAPGKALPRYMLGLTCAKAGDLACAREALARLRDTAPDLARKLEAQIRGPHTPPS